MTIKILQAGFFYWVLSLYSNQGHAQDKRAQYPAVLSNSYVGVNIGYINYPFSNLQLERGYEAEAINIPHTAVKVILFGHRFNKNLSAEISYLRPVDWVKYKNINGDGRNHSVRMNVVGLSLRSQWPVTKKFSIYGEGGLGIITRKGISFDTTVILKDANYATVLLSTGLQYSLNNKWDLLIGMDWSPAHARQKQPYVLFFSGGFNYTMRPLPAKIVARNSTSFSFPKQVIQLGWTTSALGYGVNDLFSKGPVPIFWGGEAHVANGFSINYQRNIFHTLKVFSLDWGAGVSYWKSSKNNEGFYTVALYPVLRFTALRTKGADIYFNYSIAGPSFISKTIIDGFNTGKRFTFQDFMGMGVYSGKKRNLNAEIRIAHYSNGNLFPQNAGVKIPLSFNLGYAF